MAKRRSTGKRLRFEVFHRDHFTCQYCGAQPPDVVLVLDHVTPVSKGGDDSLENLITACEACNQGKSDKSLSSRPIRPDADLLYLQTQQEIAEVRRYQQAVADRERAIAELIAQLQDAWSAASGLDWVPSDTIVRQVINRYSHEPAYEAILDVAGKVGTGYLDDRSDKWIPYLFSVARNLSDAHEGEGE